MPTSVVVIINRVELDRFRGWTGPIGMATYRLAKTIEGFQIGIAPFKTGKLRSQITTGRKGRWAGGVEINVGANPNRSIRGYAMSTEVGAAPHRIVAHREPYLKFFWPKVGRVVRFRSVNHPGMMGRHWAILGAASGMDVWERTGIVGGL